MRFYIHIPRNYNDRRPIERSELGKTFRELVEEFNGYSWIRANHLVPNLGIKSGGIYIKADRRYRDANFLFFIDVQDSDIVEKMEWLWKYKRELERRLQQEWIYIAYHHVSVLA